LLPRELRWPEPDPPDRPDRDDDMVAESLTSEETLAWRSRKAWAEGTAMVLRDGMPCRRARGLSVWSEILEEEDCAFRMRDLEMFILAGLRRSNPRRMCAGWPEAEVAWRGSASEDSRPWLDDLRSLREAFDGKRRQAGTPTMLQRKAEFGTRMMFCILGGICQSRDVSGERVPGGEAAEGRAVALPTLRERSGRQATMERTPPG
jgi:hypothetical protein